MAYVPDIAKLLLGNDPVLLNEWRRFYDALELGPVKLAQLDYGFRTSTIGYYDLFSEILKAWVSKYGGDARVSRLVAILREESFISSSDSVSSAFSQTPDALIHSYRETDEDFEPLLSTSLTEVQTPAQPKGPLWYKVEQAAASFEGRKAELKQIQTYFRNQKGTGQSARVFLHGEPCVGKSELARKFAANFSYQENSNCVWIDGARVKKSFVKFLQKVSRVPIPPEASSSVHLASLKSTIMGSDNSWLFIFDAIDDPESQKFVEGILQEFSKLPPIHDPMVLVTSEKEFGSISIKLCHWTEWNLTFMAGHLAQVTASLVADCMNDMGAVVQRVGTNVVLTIEALATDPTLAHADVDPVVVMKALISLLALLGYFIVATMDEQDVFKAWTSICQINRATQGTDEVLRKVFRVLSSTLKVLDGNNGTALEPPKPEVSVIIKQMFIRSHYLRDYLAKAVDLPPGDFEPALFRQLLQTLGPSIEGEDENIETLVRKIMSDPTCMSSCKYEIIETMAKSTDEDLVIEVHANFSKTYGPTDDSTLVILGYLCHSLESKGNFLSVSKYQELYAINKAKYGPLDPKTFSIYVRMLQCIDKFGSRDGVALRKEMIAFMETAYGPTSTQVIEERYNLALQIMKTDEMAGRKELSDLSPLCERHHPQLYLNIRNYLDTCSKVKNAGFKRHKSGCKVS